MITRPGMFPLAGASPCCVLYCNRLLQWLQFVLWLCVSVCVMHLGPPTAGATVCLRLVGFCVVTGCNLAQLVYAHTCCGVLLECCLAGSGFAIAGFLPSVLKANCGVLFALKQAPRGWPMMRWADISVCPYCEWQANAHHGSCTQVARSLPAYRH